jgi:hypothetical protein
MAQKTGKIYQAYQVDKLLEISYNARAIHRGK